MHKLFLFLPLFFFLSMCRSDDEVEEYDCSAVSCEAGFSKFYIEILDSTGRKNVLTEGEYTANDIAITGNETVRFRLENEFERDLLVVSDSVWKIGAFN